MQTHPILFSTPMVQAILEGRKTMTRRIVKPNPRISSDPSKVGEIIKDLNLLTACDYGYYGYILWVKETYSKEATIFNDSKSQIIYKADDHVAESEIKWKPSIFMPKSACRIFLQITDLRVERLDSITEEDAISEGVIKLSDNYYKDYAERASGFHYAGQSFRSLWKKINGDESWNFNPWVWVISFERCEKPENL